MHRILPALGLLAAATGAQAQTDRSDIVIRTLLDHSCELTDAEARPIFEAQGIPWDELLRVLNDMERAGQVHLPPDGRSVFLDPVICHPEPIVTHRPGPPPTVWLEFRLGREEACRLPLATLRADGRADGIDPDWLDDVIEGYLDFDWLRQEGDDVMLSPLSCASQTNARDMGLLALSSVLPYAWADAVARALADRSCRMPMADRDATTRRLAEGTVARLDLDPAPGDLSPLAMGLVEDRVREVLAERTDLFALERASGDLVLLRCPG